MGSDRAGTIMLLAIPRAETVHASSRAPVSTVRDAVRDTPGVVGVADDGTITVCIPLWAPGHADWRSMRPTKDTV